MESFISTLYIHLLIIYYHDVSTMSTRVLKIIKNSWVRCKTTPTSENYRLKKPPKRFPLIFGYQVTLPVEGKGCDAGGIGV